MGVSIGAIDPTLSLGQEWQVTSADLRALDLVGWELLSPSEVAPAPVPEPSVSTFLLLGFAAFGFSRRRHGSTAS